jgi:NTE family protein
MMRTRPDVLVLGAGGVLGAAWMSGVLGGIEDASGLDLRMCEHFVGTSAGAIVAAGLAAGESPRRPSDRRGRVGRRHGSDGRRTRPALAAVATRSGGRRTQRVVLSDGSLRLVGELAAVSLRTTRRAGAWATALSSPLAPVALRVGEPGGALARSAVLRLMPRGSGTLDELDRAIAPIDGPFDGRLRVVAVRRDSGRRTVFGRPGAPAASVRDAVLASCALPWLIAPVSIGGREYIDGAIWSPTNIDAAPVGQGTHVLVLNPAAGVNGPSPVAAVVHGALRSRAILETQALRARGARVRTLTPDAESITAIGTDLMDRTRRGAVLQAGYHQGLAFARR